MKSKICTYIRYILVNIFLLQNTVKIQYGVPRYSATVTQHQWKYVNRNSWLQSTSIYRHTPHSATLHIAPQTEMNKTGNARIT